MTDDIYGLSLPGTFPLLWYKGWSPVAFPSMMMSAGMTSSTLGLFPGQEPMQLVLEDWSRVFVLRKGGWSGLLPGVRDTKEGA